MLSLDDKIYKREVLPLEAIFIRSMGAIIGVAAEISGEIFEDKFKIAVNKVKSTYPILNCALTWDENGKPWFQKSKIDPLVIIKERVLENDYEKIIVEEWNKTFDLINGPLCRFILLKSKEKSNIIFIAHHILSDGIGLTIIIESILKFMKDKNLNTEISYINKLPSIENLKPKNNFNILFNQLLYKYISSFLNYRWERSKIHLPPEDAMLTHEIFFNSYEYCPINDELSEEETTNFIKKCKENKVTVTCAMATAFLACRNEIDKEHDNSRQMIPVNLRRHLDNESKKAVNCHAGSIDIKYSYDDSKSFWENSKIYNKLIKNALKNFSDVKKIQVISNFPTDLLETSILSQRIQTFEDMFGNVFSYADKLGSKSNHVTSMIAKYVMKQNPTFCLTNMGTPEFSDNYGPLKIEKMFIYPSGVVYPAMSILLSTVTLNNRLFLSFNIAKKKSEKFEDREYIALRLKERYKRFLTKDIFI